MKNARITECCVQTTIVEYSLSKCKFGEVQGIQLFLLNRNTVVLEMFYLLCDQGVVLDLECSANMILLVTIKSKANVLKLVFFLDCSKLFLEITVVIISLFILHSIEISLVQTIVVWHPFDVSSAL